MTDPIQAAIMAERERALASSPGPSQPVAADDILSNGCRLMADALAYRMGGPEPEDDRALRFIGSSFSDMVATLTRLRGISWNGRADLLTRAITTGDLPELVTEAGNRVLRAAYQSYAGGLFRACGRVPSRDFRPVRLFAIDGDLALQEVDEAGPISEGTLRASGETFSIGTFGRRFSASRTMLQDDDLQAIADLSRRLGSLGAEFTAGRLVTLLESNPTLGDGVALFDAAHGNVGTAGALSETTLGELLKLMRLQTGLGGESIAAVPRFVIVPAALEVSAKKLVWTLGPNSGLEVIVEPRLTSATAYYLASDPQSLAGIVYAYPGASDAPRIEFRKRPGFEGLSGRVLLDVGCGISEYRALARNAGA